MRICFTCVYTHDFEDVDGVRRVLVALRGLDLMNARLSYNRDSARGSFDLAGANAVTGQVRVAQCEGRQLPFVPCQPKGYDWSDGLATKLCPTSDSVFFSGTAGSRYRQIEITYADGDRAQVTPHSRFFLFAIRRRIFGPDTKWRRLKLAVRMARRSPVRASSSLATTCHVLPTTANRTCP